MQYSNTRDIVLFGGKYTALSLLVPDLTLFDRQFLDTVLIIRIRIAMMGLLKALVHIESDHFSPIWAILAC